MIVKYLVSVVVGVGPASIMVGNLVAGKRIAQASGRDLGMIEDQDLVRKVLESLSTIQYLSIGSFCKHISIF